MNTLNKIVRGVGFKKKGITTQVKRSCGGCGSKKALRVLTKPNRTKML